MKNPESRGGEDANAESDRFVRPHRGGAFHVILVNPEIAENVGAIGRTCVAVGATLWLVRPLGFRLDDRHRRRAALDYWDHLDLRLIDAIDEATAAIGRDRLWSFSTRGNRRHTAADFATGDGLVFGPESRGLSAAWLDTQPPERVLRIPMRPEARSLNLSNAVAIGLYEALRQSDARP